MLLALEAIAVGGIPAVVVYGYVAVQMSALAGVTLWVGLRSDPARVHVPGPPR